jgi:thiamine pyrophosphokinase
MKPHADDPGRPRAVVFLNGTYTSAEFDRGVAAAGDLLLAADGGAARMHELGLRPSAVVGDFDSLDPDVASRLAADGVAIERHPVRKDRTDAELAVEAALSMGARSIILTGGAQGALDHVLGHLVVLRRLAVDGVEAALVDVSLWATAVAAPVDLLLSGIDGRRVSLLAPTDAVVSLRGFEYELEHGRVPADACLGLGNTAIGPRQSVRVHEGRLLVLVEGDGLSPRCVLKRPAER